MARRKIAERRLVAGRRGFGHHLAGQPLGGATVPLLQFRGQPGIAAGGLGNRPAAGRQLDDLLGRVGLGSGAKVSQFGGDSRPAQVHPPADDQCPADAAADVGIEDDAAAAAGPEPRLAQPGHVGVVGHGRRQGKRPAAPVGQREIVPAGDVMALDGPSGGDVDRPAKAEADGPDAVLAAERRGDLLDLPPDALGAVGRADVGPLRVPSACRSRRRRRRAAISCRRFQCRGTCWLSLRPLLPAGKGAAM